MRGRYCADSLRSRYSILDPVTRSLTTHGLAQMQATPGSEIPMESGLSVIHLSRPRATLIYYEIPNLDAFRRQILQ